ncbi:MULTISPECIES: type II toxin-antitoxin system ParD family antitoxin [unclassified Synechococcus]|uniref:type II toxin-antitoxin system ParD family antitoxin n=1 Tax=unclassified Synechococcus TaxID=2626047 RepID=UPI0021A8048F|nr:MULTISPECIES: type II toxin-antitoxin system ParD family antitoxin [unclassified Synechococcus]MCT0212096.1 type II toxin-antitoxin system ParD family antitoxin [Synechococcus sp. CS-1326]MCT0234217.1 type II toxin-antitoxin system ParD family antitoxin [Synechococcus sp. CS-1327]
MKIDVLSDKHRLDGHGSGPQHHRIREGALECFFPLRAHGARTHKNRQKEKTKPEWLLLARIDKTGAMVKVKVASGLYTSASEVLREALRLMEQQDHLRSIKLQQLRSDVQEGLASGEPSEWNAVEIKQHGRNLKASRRITPQGA